MGHWQFHWLSFKKKVRIVYSTLNLASHWTGVYQGLEHFTETFDCHTTLDKIIKHLCPCMCRIRIPAFYKNIFVSSVMSWTIQSLEITDFNDKNHCLAYPFGFILLG